MDGKRMRRFVPENVVRAGLPPAREAVTHLRAFRSGGTARIAADHLTARA